MNEPKKLYRLDHGMLAGVCGGVAEYFNMDPSLVRLLWVVLTVVSFSLGFWVYLIAAIILPRKSDVYPGFSPRGPAPGAACQRPELFAPGLVFHGPNVLY
ncbi:PspC domain-containing protein [Intestinimonas sp.]|uniref:PspC domain-containing protein n=1 Tax=Intestinimonas sp. TaxID=1965293 RepID=UPI003AB893F1